MNGGFYRRGGLPVRRNRLIFQELCLFFEKAGRLPSMVVESNRWTPVVDRDERPTTRLDGAHLNGIGEFDVV